IFERPWNKEDRCRQGGFDFSPARAVGKSPLRISKECSEIDLSSSIERKISMAVTQPRDGFPAAFFNPDEVDIAVVVDISGKQSTGFQDRGVESQGTPGCFTKGDLNSFERTFRREGGLIKFVIGVEVREYRFPR